MNFALIDKGFTVKAKKHFTYLLHLPFNIMQTETPLLMSKQDIQNQETNAKLELAEKFVNLTGEHVFLTGRAGTGKTTFLQRIRKMGLKRSVVVAPTGVAAINAGGVTIHSFFQMPFGPVLPPGHENNSEGEKLFQRKFNKEKINIIRSLDLLIIDEISMVRADLLDGIDLVLKRYRGNRKAFGGLQVLMIGDLEQLAPVVRENEWQLLSNYYEHPFFFNSRVLQETRYISIVLDHVYRQKDQAFISTLNKVRSNELDQHSLEELNKRYIPGFIERENPGYIILTTHNKLADEINARRLNQILEKSYHFEAEIEGIFPEQLFPTHEKLELKIGAQVMFIKNDPSPDKKYYNGKIGVVEEIEGDTIFVKCEGEDDVISVEAAIWENLKYSLDKETRELKENVAGIFRQLPLRHAWAITIHKSQGLTFDKAIIDAQSAFAHGQVYVALRRCKSLEGMVLNAPLENKSFIRNERVNGFTRAVEENHPDRDQLNVAMLNFRRDILADLFSFYSLRDRLQSFVRKYHDLYSSIAGSEPEVLNKLNRNFEKDVIRVSEKFHPLIGKLLMDNENLAENLLLQEKVSGAAVYFLNHLESSMVPQFEKIEFETDNKEIRTLLEDRYMQVLKEASFKTSLLESCRNGFDLAPYLEVKAKASMEDIGKRKNTNRKAARGPGEVLNKDLYSDLVQWRNMIASENGIPHYMIIHLKTLVALANYAPYTIKEMKMIPGIGKVTLEKYGADLLEIIRQSGSKPMIELKEEETGNSKKKKRKKKGGPSSSELSLQMFLEGKSIMEIAVERELTEGTINNHLAIQVNKGKLDITSLLSKESIHEISNYFGKNEEANLKQAFEDFKRKYSYENLRLVRNWIGRPGSKNS